MLSDSQTDVIYLRSTSFSHVSSPKPSSCALLNPNAGESS